MSEEVTEVVATTGTEIASPAPTPPAAEATTEVTVSKSTEPEVPEAPAFQPNFKFKVMDEEKEIDEFVRGAIKDQESEKKIRELYEKAYGLDYVKPKYEERGKKLQEVEGRFAHLDSLVRDTMDLRDKDFWGFCEKLGLNKEQVAKHVLEEVRKLELPEDQKRIYDELETTRREKLQLEKQYQTEQVRSQERAVQARTHELDTVLTRPEISAYAKAYDSARKKSGAFQEMVIRHGNTEWNINQRDVTAEQAVFDVMSMLGEHYRGGVATPTTQSQPNADGKPLPVIPRVSGRSVSPTGKAPRSIADLKKLAANFEG